MNLILSTTTYVLLAALSPNLVSSPPHSKVVQVPPRQSQYDDSSLPPGWKTRDKKPGENVCKGSVMAHTDPDKKEIIIARRKISKIGDSQATTDSIIETIRNHEIKHIAGKGPASDPGWPGTGNGPCAHMQIESEQHQELCNKIEDALANGDDELAWDLCVFSGGMTDKLNQRKANHPECPLSQSGGDWSNCPGC